MPAISGGSCGKIGWGSVSCPSKPSGRTSELEAASASATRFSAYAG
jgi:hypothetical protein